MGHRVQLLFLALVTLTITLAGDDRLLAGELAGTAPSQAAPTLAPSSRDFGSVEVGTFGTRTLILTAGAESVRVLRIATDSSAFRAFRGGCRKTLTTGKSCTIYVIFAPLEEGNDSAIVTITLAGGTSLTSELRGVGFEATDTTTETTTNTTTAATTETTPTGLPPLRPRPPGGLFQKIDEKLEVLPLVAVVFNYPTELQKGEAAEIQLLLSLKKSTSALQDELTEVGEREGVTVKVSPVMRALLSGTGFSIDPPDPVDQAVAANANTEWTWEIVPTKTGTQTLHLKLFALIDVEGERTPRQVRVLNRPIVISVSWPDRITGFVGDNWQWLWAAILVPLATLSWTAWRRRHDGSQSTGTAKPPDASVAAGKRRRRRDGSRRSGTDKSKRDGSA